MKRTFYKKGWETPEAATFRRCRNAWLKGDMATVQRCRREAQLRIEGQTNTYMKKPSEFDPEWLRASWAVTCYLHLTKIKVQYEKDLGFEGEDTYQAAVGIWS